MLHKHHLETAENFLILLDTDKSLKIIFKSKIYSPSIDGNIIKVSENRYTCTTQLDDCDGNCMVLDRCHTINKIATLFMDDDFIIEII